MKKRQTLSALLLLTFVIALFAGCGVPVQSASPAFESVAPVSESSGSLVVYDDYICVSADPLKATTTEDISLIAQLYEGIYTYAVGADGSAVPKLGQAKAVSQVTNADDSITYTFTLRDDAVWSDGKPVTAADFVYAWKRASDMEDGSDYRDFFNCIAGYGTEEGIDVSAPEDKVFVVTLSAYCEYFEQLCAIPMFSPVRQDVVEADPDGWDADPAQIVTNGPFSLETMEPEVKTVLRKSDSYYDAKSISLSGIEFHFSSDTDSAAAFEKGECSVVLSTTVIPDGISEAQIRTDTAVSSAYLELNTNKAPLNDPRVRRALSLATDRNALASVEIGGSSKTVTSCLVPSGIWDVDGANGADFRAVGGQFISVDAADYEANCQQARELLAEAGYPEGAGFPKLTIALNNREESQPTYEALAKCWKDALGIELELVTYPAATYYSDIDGSVLDIVRTSYSPDYNYPSAFLNTLLTDGSANFLKYSSEQYDSLVAAANKDTDVKQAMQKFHDAERYVCYEDCAVIPMYAGSSTYLCADNVSGILFDIEGVVRFRDVKIS